MTLKTIREKIVRYIFYSTRHSNFVTCTLGEIAFAVFVSQEFLGKRIIWRFFIKEGASTTKFTGCQDVLRFSGNSILIINYRIT
jgi:hypothetical protein